MNLGRAVLEHFHFTRISRSSRVAELRVEWQHHLSRWRCSVQPSAVRCGDGRRRRGHNVARFSTQNAFRPLSRVSCTAFSVRKVFLLSHRTVPNEAGDHRAALNSLLAEGGSLTPPTSHPHKYNGLYGPGYISVMTPGDPLAPPSRPIEPPFSVGEVREVVEKPSTLGRIFRCVSRPAPGWGGVAP